METYTISISLLLPRPLPFLLQRQLHVQNPVLGFMVSYIESLSDTSFVSSISFADSTYHTYFPTIPSNLLDLAL